MGTKISNRKLREFGLIVGVILPLFFGWIIPMISGHDFREWTLYLGVILISLAILKPNFLYNPYKLWIGIGNILGWFNSRLILGIIFFVILQPMAIFMRLCGYDPLRRNKNKNKSYREEKINYKIDLKRIF